jgi:hypothetical protein
VSWEHGSVMNVRIFFGLAAGLTVLGALGCGTGQTGSSAAGSAGTGGDGGSGSAGSSGSSGSGGSPVCPDDPADGPVPEACGVWVSASMGDDANEGNQVKPVKTLTHAIELAAKGPGHVYACEETWNEALQMPENVSMHGGFDCTNGWKYIATNKLGGDHRAILIAGSDQIPLMLINGVTGKEPFVTDFYIEAVNAKLAGGSSIGVFVRDEMPFTLRRCEIVAGEGMAGLDGAPGGSMAAPDGPPGKVGANACSAPVSKGGAASENPCDWGSSRGGAGGDASDKIAANGEGGTPAGIAPGGMWGLGQENAPACTDGSAGSDGKNGELGLGAWTGGYLTRDGYLGLEGEDGKPGYPGQGGGGGGATFGKVAVCGAASPGGAAGGAGGAGGCGGKGGSGGKPGGASLAVAIRAKSHNGTLDAVVLRPTKGGKGGNGGAPQTGGSGGDPGQGGVGAGSIKPGCAGGAGGKGGNGGWGGGGQGGLSACWTTVNSHNPAQPGGTRCYQGTDVEGGQGDPFKPAGLGYPGFATGGQGLAYWP